MALKNDVQLQILKQKLELWCNTHFSATWDAKIAETLGDDGMRQQAVKQMKSALQAQSVIKDAIASLEG